jgi:hypothetical protein
MDSKALGDEAFVIRGGLMELLPLRIALDTCQARWDFHGLSFYGDDGLSVPQIVEASDIQHPRIRVTAGRIRAIGRQVERFGQHPHLTLRFEISPSDEEARSP